MNMVVKWSISLLFLEFNLRTCVCQYGDPVGCFNDRRHEFTFFWWEPGTEFARHSATSCSQYCYNQKFLYAGLAGPNGSNCHCGNGGYNRYRVSGACGWCDNRNERFQCGNADSDPYRLLFVYRIVHDPPATVDVRHVGCWTSNHAPNVLDHVSMHISDLPANNMAVDGCINRCRQEARRYAGIFKGTECWCGNELQWEGGGRSPAYTNYCNIKCPGNDTEMCGGDRFISIYRSECHDGTYGLGGKACEPCYCESNMVCDKNTGQCPGPCIRGYAPTPPSGPCIDGERKTWMAIGLGAGAGITLLLVIGLTTFFIRRRRANVREDTSCSPYDTYDNYQTVVDVYAEGRNTCHHFSKLLEVMKIEKHKENPFQSEFYNLPAGYMTVHDPNNDQQKRISKTNTSDAENRVTLSGPRSKHSIDAFYIKNYEGKYGYIVTEEPSSSAVDDFLQLIWQENVSKIVTLTDKTHTHKKKYVPHWTSVGNSRKLQLNLTQERELPCFTVRTFALSKDGAIRYLKHYMFSGWCSNKSTRPLSSILQMLEMVKNYGRTPDIEAKTYGGNCNDEDQGTYESLKRPSDPHDYYNIPNGPMLVHCSDGISSTGAFIAIDYILEQAKKEGRVDVFDCVYKLRQQKMDMVPSLKDYQFIYTALLKELVVGSTSIPADRTRLGIQFEVLEILKPVCNKADVTGALKLENKPKNRSQKILPLDCHRPILNIPYQESTGYINAVQVEGYKESSSLVTQLPMGSTFADFWCMVFEYKSPVIVSLQCPEEEIYWPGNVNDLKSCGDFTILCLAVEKTNEPKINKITLTVSHKQINSMTTILLLIDWPAEKQLMESKTIFALAELIRTHRYNRSTMPVILQCMYGYARSGLVCALMWLMDVIKNEDQVDLFHCVQQIQSSRPEFIHNLEQYEFLHDAAVEYIFSLSDLYTGPTYLTTQIHTHSA